MHLNVDGAGNVILDTSRHYYLWLFGPIVRIPYDRNYTDVIPQDSSDADFELPQEEIEFLESTLE